MKNRVSARSKLEKQQERRLVDDPKGRGKMLIPRPLDIDNEIRGIPSGKLATMDQIRDRLAKQFNADLTCPLCAGMFLRIAAEAAEEDHSQGKQDITPYWRVIRADGTLNEKLPGGVMHQAARLRAEGHVIEEGKKLPRVRGFEKALEAQSASK